MCNVIGFIVDNASLVLSAVVALATIAYTWINYLMYKENKASREHKLKPEIVPYLQSTASKKVLCLFIKNVGEGCAKDVRVKLLNDYKCLGDEDWPLSKFPLFNEGINVYPPGYELHYYINFWDDIRKKDMDGYLEMEVSYTDIKGKQGDKVCYKLKFNQIMSNYSNPPDNNEDLVVHHLEKISKTLDAISKK